MSGHIDYARTREFWVERGRVAPEWMDYAASADRYLARSWQADIRRRQMRFLLERAWPSTPPRVLDLGCGPGTWAMAMAPHCRSLLGVDLSAGFVEEAQRAASAAGHGHLDFRVGSFLDFQSPSAVDLVILGGVLVYVDDDDLPSFLRRVRGTLAPGGTVYARTGIAPRTRRMMQRNSTAVYRPHAQYLSAFQEAGFSVATTRDHTYTYSMVAAILSGAAHYATAGLSARPGPARVLRGVLETLSPVVFGLGGRLLDLTPIPRCNHYVLTPA